MCKATLFFTFIYHARTNNLQLYFLNILKTKSNLNYTISMYRAVNTLRLGYKNQSVNPV